MEVDMTMEEPQTEALQQPETQKNRERLIPRARGRRPEPYCHVIAGQAASIDGVSYNWPSRVNARAAGAAYDTKLVLSFYVH